MLAVVCTFTKFLWLFPLKTKETHVVAESLIYVFDQYGFGAPKTLQSDNGKEFVSQTIRKLQEHYGFQIVHSRPYHPQSQGVVERINQTVGQMMAKLEEDCRNRNVEFAWSDQLFIAKLCSQYNRGWHSSIRMTPFEAMFGRQAAIQSLKNTVEAGDVIEAQLDEDGVVVEPSASILLSPTPDDPVGLRQRYREATQKNLELNMKRIAKRRGTLVEFDVGDAVYVKTHQNKAAKRGSVSKLMNFKGKIVHVYRLPNGDRSHMYDVELLDQPGRVDKVSLSKLKVRA